MPLAAAPDPTVAGTVAAVTAGGDRALVRLADGRLVAICREQITPLVPLDRVLVVGMSVEGVLDPSGAELHLDLEAPSPAMLDALFPDGVVTPALVTKVGQLGGELALHPAVRVTISRRDVSSNPKDRIDTLLEVGETVAARVFRHADGTIRLRLIDVDDDEPVQPALALLPGGPEWLGFPPEQVREMRVELGQALHDRDLLGRLLGEERAKVAELRKAARGASAPASRTGRQRRERHPDAETWVRHEVYGAWLDRVPAAERVQYPLHDFVIGVDFAASLEALDGDRLDKALRAVVDVLTHRAEAMSSRAVHALRTSEFGGAPEVVREDGARCLRCAIENDPPSARRLHWWKGRDGPIELSRVVLHDDTRP